MSLQRIRFLISALTAVPAMFAIADPVFAANYPLQILLPRAAGTSPDPGGPTINSGHRIFWAYPGIPYNILASVIGGAYPYTYALSGAPAGMTINSSTGEINWPNPTGTTVGPITFTVTDAEGTQAQTTWSVTIDSTKFLFLDQVNGRRATGNGCSTNCGTGTLANPFKDISDWYGGNQYADKTENIHVGKLVYYRTGTYPVDAYVEDNWRVPILGEYKPVTHMAYPGESPVINLGAGTLPGAAWAFYGQNNGVYLDGLRFVSTANPTLQNVITYPSGSFQTFTRNVWGGVVSAERSLNQSCLLAGSSQDSNVSAYMTVRSNTCDGVNLGAGFKFYSLRKALIADNVVANVVDTTFGSEIEGIALKFGIDRADVRSNWIYNVADHAIGGNMNSGAVLTRDLEIRFNRTTGLNLNQNGNAGVIYVYRNTMTGRVLVQNTDSADGPFYFSNNVIVNLNEGTPSGSHITMENVSAPTRIVISSNLVGYPSDNIVGPDSKLTSTYSSYLGTHGFELGGPRPPAPRNLRVQ